MAGEIPLPGARLEADMSQGKVLLQQGMHSRSHEGDQKGQNLTWEKDQIGEVTQNPRRSRK